MDAKKYLDKFQQAADQLDEKTLREKNMKSAVGLYGSAVFLKLFKISWANPSHDPLTVASRIFFSVWVNDSIPQDQKIYYNINALKLRQLKGYAIESRKFAAAFRAGFELFQDDWQNVSVQFGPQTLLQGWVIADERDFQNQIPALARKFLTIEHLVDSSLQKFKQVAHKR